MTEADRISQGKNAPALSVRGICKSFGKNEVLRGIDMDLLPGEVLALVGGNGAGKSTLVKCVMGIHKPDSGEIFIGGERLEFSRPDVSLGRGAYLVPQEPMLFPNMTAEQNVLMGFRERKSVLKARLAAIAEQLGWKLDLSRSARTLSIAEQSLVEILRGLLRDARVLFLDEPTSALTFDEAGSLFRVIEALKKKNIAIVYITHRLNEVFMIATRVAIMRDGLIALSGRVGDFDRGKLLAGLLPEGFSGKAPAKKTAASVAAQTKPVFELCNFGGYGFSDVNMSIRPGEVLGLCGVVGAGRTELAMTIFGRDACLSGRALLDGENITGMKTSAIIKRGINYVPEDRFLNGVFRNSSLAVNLSSAYLSSMSRFFVNFTAERALAEKCIGEFSVKGSARQEMASLSGGNQQKIVIGRCLSTDPRLVILDEPTRGIDAGARGDIYAIIAELKERGVAILLISSDMEEIVELSDRAMTMFQGRINREFSSREEITEDTLTRASFGSCEDGGI